jgi:hypothetical protein
MSGRIVRTEFKKSFTDITGKTYGRLTVLNYAYSIQNKQLSYSNYWKCQCECGKLHYATTGNLVNSLTRSCGCIKNQEKKGMKFGRPTKRDFESKIS